MPPTVGSSNKWNTWEFRDTHILEIRNLSENATEVLWDNISETKNSTKITPQSPYTDLSQGILSSLRVEDDENEDNHTSNIRGAALSLVMVDIIAKITFETAKLLSVRN